MMLHCFIFYINMSLNFGELAMVMILDAFSFDKVMFVMDSSWQKRNRVCSSLSFVEGNTSSAVDAQCQAIFRDVHVEKVVGSQLFVEGNSI